MINNIEHLTALQAPTRAIKARVEHFKGSTLYQTYNHFDVLQSLTIDRVGTHNFFGMGICQNVEIKLLDANREIVIEKDDYFKVYFGVNDSYICNFPLFYVSEITRDENTNAITAKAWDKITKASAHKIEELEITYPLTVADYATLTANILGLSVIYPIENESFKLSYAEPANYSGSESLRDLLDDIAEITQTIYYIDATGNIVFKQLEMSNSYAIDKSNYFSLTSKEAVVLGDIGNTTELGDNITAESGIEGATTQYIRNNGLLDLREDRATILQNAVSAISGLTINPFDCDYRGNYLLEIGDCLALATKDENIIYSFLLDEKITYSGGLSAVLAWEFAGDTETNSNSATLGEMLNETFAKVDKAAKEVLIVVSEVDENSKNISSLQMTTGGITAEVAELDAKVSTAITSEDVRLEIKREIAENGIDKVITNTGFVFDDVGLTVSKSGTEMTTTITEDGMIVEKNGNEMLKADNVGVVATNLHARTYLTVGENSRFENYGSSRTGCFWIG